jgi:hypothetical protein
MLDKLCITELHAALHQHWLTSISHGFPSQLLFPLGLTEYITRKNCDETKVGQMPTPGASDSGQLCRNTELHWAMKMGWGGPWRKKELCRL